MSAIYFRPLGDVNFRTTKNAKIDLKKHITRPFAVLPTTLLREVDLLRRLLGFFYFFINSAMRPSVAFFRGKYFALFPGFSKFEPKSRPWQLGRDHNEAGGQACGEVHEKREPVI